MQTIERILVPVDFSPCSDAALAYALKVADACGAEVELLHVWRPQDRTIFAETPQGVAMEQRLSAAAFAHPARVSGRLEFGEEPSRVILDILNRERFDMVVVGRNTRGHVAASIAQAAPCKVVTLPSGGRPSEAVLGPR